MRKLATFIAGLFALALVAQANFIAPVGFLGGDACSVSNIAFDATSNGTAGTGNISWTHTPVGTPKGVVVFVTQNGVTTDHVTGVTYGGVAMTEMAGSPSGFADGGGSALYAYHLGSGIPTGAQTVLVSANTSTKEATAYTVTSNCSTTEVVDTSIGQAASAALAQVTVSLGGQTAWVALGGWSEASSPTNISPLAGWTSDNEHDFSNETAIFYRYNTIGTADVTAGAVDGSGAETSHIFGVAIK